MVTILSKLKQVSGALLVLLISASFSYADWYSWLETTASNTIHSAAVVANNNVLAVGTEGTFFILEQDQQVWNEIPTGVPWDLYTLLPLESPQNNILLAAGDNGIVLRSSDNGQSWSEQQLNPEISIQTSAVIEKTGKIWLGGTGRTLFSSEDQGITWKSHLLPESTERVNDLFVLDRNDQDELLYVVTSSQDSSFTYYIDSADEILEGSFLLGKDWTAGTYIKPRIFLTAFDANTETTSLYSQYLIGGWPGVIQERPLQFTGSAVDVHGILDPEHSQNQLFVASSEGIIYESNDNGLSWKSTSLPVESDQLTNIILREDVKDPQPRISAMTVLYDGRILANGFDYSASRPGINERLSSGLDEFWIEYTHIPNLESLESGLTVRSNYSGRLFFASDYDPADSHRVMLNYNRLQSSVTVPGETWNISMDQSILDQAGVPNTLTPLNYDAAFLPEPNPDFNFEVRPADMLQNSAGSNFVAGWFNDDPLLDMITYVNGLLMIYTAQEDGRLEWVKSEGFPISIEMRPEIDKQLLSADLDLDGDPDLILYDDTEVYIILNQSTGLFTFQVVSQPYLGSGIRQVGVYNADHNAEADLLVLDNTLTTLLNITNSFAEPAMIPHPEPADLAQYTGFSSADMDADGIQDVILIGTSDIFLIKGNRDGSLGPGTPFVHGKTYHSCELADLDNDRFLELIAFNDTEIDVFTINRTDFTSLDIAADSPLAVADAGNIQSIIVQDFGQRQGNYGDGFPDILALTDNQRIKIFENVSFSPLDFAFIEHPGKEITIEIPSNAMIDVDLNKDGKLDLLTNNKLTGRFQPVLKSSWAPQFISSQVTEEGIVLNWDSFNDILGSFDFYRLLRFEDDLNDISPVSVEINSVDITDFVDKNVQKFKRYIYFVQAFYDGGVQSERSNPQVVETYLYLNNPLPAALTDSSYGYIAQNPISVDRGDSLFIGPGIQILFENESAFDILGSLKIEGSEDHLVTFQGNPDNPQLNWAGLNIQPGEGTVYISWFSAGRAFTALQIDQRPVEYQFGGLALNETAISISGDSLTLENVSVDSNGIGIQVVNNARAFIKNIDILHNLTAGVLVDNSSRLHLKNSIIWQNQGPGIVAQNGSQVNLAYSTIDRWQGAANHLEVSQLDPKFMPADSGYNKPALMSPTIDAGDPMDNFDLEPEPNGSRINQGLYGGTWLATPTFQPQIVVEPDSIIVASKPLKADTTNLMFTNMGNVPLNIDAFEFSVNSGVFNIPEDATYSVEPGNSVQTEFIFIPEKRITYLDTLSILSDDPHQPAVKINIQGTGLNTAPIITGRVPDTAWVGSLFQHAIQVFDEDQDTLAFSAVEMPEWLTVSDDGLLSGTPGIDDTLRLHQVDINITDSFGASVLFSQSIVVAFINQPPTWEAPISLDLVEDIQPEPFDLTDLVSDENTPFDGIKFDVYEIQDSSAITAFISDHHFLNIQLSKDYFNLEPTQVILSATDIKGLTSYDSIDVKVDGVEDAPRFIPVADTTIYTNVLLDLPVIAWDVDGQEISYSDDTELFNIHPDSGLIRFRPVLGDTGIYAVGLTFDDGVQTAQDTFNLSIKVNPVKSPFDFQADGMDQAIDLSFSMPEMEFYSGTRIYYSKLSSIGSPNRGVLGLDTTFSDNSSTEPVSVTVSGLEIGQRYFISVFNYYFQNGYIYSPPLQGEVQTLAPMLQTDSSEIRIALAVNRETTEQIKIKNTGGGTLLFRTTYPADSLTRIWFDADTTLKKVSPGDSTLVTILLHPNRQMERRDYEVWIHFESNMPSNNQDSIKVILEPIFDDFAPDIRIVSRPDSVVREAAVFIRFMADDTTGKPIGDPAKNILKSYRCINVTSKEIVFQGDSLTADRVMLYPLDDGFYQLRLWGYDLEGNGRFGSNSVAVNFIIKASAINVPANKWYMMAVPRPIQFSWEEFVSDSLIKLYRWNNEENRYLPVQFTADEENTMGNAFWLYPQRYLNIDARIYPHATLNDSLVADIEKGWNQVGLPIAYKSFWRDMWFRSASTNAKLTLEEAVEQDIISPAVYWYRHNKNVQGYEWGMLDSVIAEPWRGYWFKSNQDGELIFSRKPAIQTAATVITADSTQKLERKATDWIVTFDLSNEIYEDRRNILGITSAEKPYQIHEPPHFSEYCSFFYESELGPLTRYLQSPFNNIDEVKSWNITIESRNMQLEHELNWFYDPDQSDLVYLYLVDKQREEIIDMSRESSLSFLPSTGTYNFSVYATQDASFMPKIIPMEYKLAQNFPNPFNPRTKIRFGIPESADGQLVTLKVFNILGQEIATLVNENLEMGYHEAEWNSTNMSGQLVSSGVYFYKLSTGRDLLVRKMILVR